MNAINVMYAHAVHALIRVLQAPVVNHLVSGYASSSLPRLFEDYEDDDEQMLCKPLQPVAGQLAVVMPHVGLRTEDWLWLPATGSCSLPEPRPSQLDVRAWLSTGKLGAPLSTHQSPADSQQHTHVDDSFEVLTQSAGDSYSGKTVL